MRWTMAVVAGLAAAGSVPSYGQGIPPPAAAPKEVQAPVGHRQARPVLLPRARPLTAPAGANPLAVPVDPDDPDERLNRALNNICRGC